MGVVDKAAQEKAGDAAPARPATQVAVRFEPAGDGGPAGDDSTARKNADEFAAALEEAGYGYGV